jgi:hypothetical protein
MSFDNIEDYKYDHLEELGGSDYEIVDGEPNVTDWPVKTPQGLKIGDVSDLLFDPESRKVRYLIVELNDSQLDITAGKNVLIPIGIAKLYSSRNVDDNVAGTAASPTVVAAGNGLYDPEFDGDVVVIQVNSTQLAQLPEYVENNVTPKTELTIRHIFEGPDNTLTYDRNGFYDHDYFDVDKFYDRGATTRSILPVTEGSLDEDATSTSPIAENPFDASIEKEEPGLGKIGF